jgi:tetratricopeptide (TPR) repeat protein
MVESAEHRGVFITHATEDDEIARQLRIHLEGEGLRCWVDSERLRPGRRLKETIESAIQEAQGQLVLLTPRAIQDHKEWIRQEIEWGREVEAESEGRFALVPVLWGLTKDELPEDLQGLAARRMVDTDAGARLGFAVREVLFGLGLTESPGLPVVPKHVGEVHELVVQVTAPRLVEEQDEAGIIRRRVHGEVALELRLPGAEPTAPGEPAPFRAPVGTLEADELRWYLESFYLWPAEAFQERAAGIEANLPVWGKALWQTVLEATGGAALVERWLEASEAPGQRRLLTIQAARPAAGDAEAAQGVAALFALPWELAWDAEDQDFLVKLKPHVALRRRLTGGRKKTDLPAAQDQLRVLMVVARPEKAGLIDPGATVSAVLDAIEPLGTTVKLDVLRPPTAAALAEALRAAWDNRKPYHVLHFDGHGVYDRQQGLGLLCFEHPDPAKRAAGEVERVSGAELRERLGQVHLPLALLEACQSGEAGEDAESAVAAALLAAGARSVLAMSHSVLVTAAQRFSGALYRGICDGLSVAEAVTTARHALLQDPRRGQAGGGHELSLRDWFVPVLLQRGDDPVLLPGGAAYRAQPSFAGVRVRQLSSLPPRPNHGFFGRLRERLAVERGLEDHRRVLLLGVGGQGKTTLAGECARWLVRTGRFSGGVAFASVEGLVSLAALVEELGKGLMGPDFRVVGAAGEGEAGRLAEADLEAAVRRLVARVRREPSLVVIDNLESLLPPPEDAPAAEHAVFDGELLQGVLDLAVALSEAGESRVLLTCREAVGDARFAEGPETRVVKVGGLSTREGVALVGEVCRLEGVLPEGELSAKDTKTLEPLTELVEAVQGHARSLVLLPPLLRERGIGAVREDLQALMAELERRHPGERERSLYASVRLSLDRLPGRWRERLPRLGVLRGGVFDQTMRILLELETEEAGELARALEARALVEREGAYLRFHPGLVGVLAGELTAEQRAAAWEWAVEAYDALVQFLYQQKDGPQRGRWVVLAVAELPNLVAVLHALAGRAQAQPELVNRVIGYATRLEGLLQSTPKQKVLGQVARVREGLATGLQAGGHGWHIAMGARYDRLLQTGDLHGALTVAWELVRAHEQAQGTTVLARYDRAESWIRLGRVLRSARQPDQAFRAVERARAGFEALGAEGNVGAARMAGLCLGDGADCLRDLGQYEAAAERYKRSINLDLAHDRRRDAAAGRGQLATCLMLQGRLEDALAGWQQARREFEALGESAMVAAAWHQIGMVFQENRWWDQAQDAYSRSLELKQQRGDKRGMCSSMNQLAIVAAGAGRLEEAVRWDRRAVQLSMELGDRGNESVGRNNLALHLRQLGQLAEAATEVRMAIAIAMNEDLGLGTEPWKSWGNLLDIATAQGDPTTAAHARSKAMHWYRRWRAQGGAPQTPGAKLTAQAQQDLQDGKGPQAAAALDTLADRPDLSQRFAPLARALAHLCRGDPAAARQLLPSLHYRDAVELSLLLDPPP